MRGRSTEEQARREQDNRQREPEGRTKGHMRAWKIKTRDTRHGESKT